MLIQLAANQTCS